MFDFWQVALTEYPGLGCSTEFFKNENGEWEPVFLAEDSLETRVEKIIRHNSYMTKIPCEFIG